MRRPPGSPFAPMALAMLGVALVDCGRVESEVAPCCVDHDGRPRASPAGGVRRWYAAKQIWFGSTVRGTSIPSTTAWRDLGFDLDLRSTTNEDSVTSRNSCRRRAGSPTKVLADGSGGIDNNFGQHVVPVMRALDWAMEAPVRADMIEGRRTFLLRLDNLTEEDNGHVSGELFVAKDFPGPSRPAFAISDHWSVSVRSLADGATMASGPKVPMFDGYVSKGAWFSATRAEGTIALRIYLGTVPFDVAIDDVALSVNLSDGRAMLGGTIDMEKLIAALRPGPYQDHFPCSVVPWDQVFETARQSVDLVHGAPNLQDLARSCDILSIGIALELSSVGEPTAVAPDPEAMLADPCADPIDGGVDGGAAG